MTCYRPNQAWLVGLKPNGKKDIRFRPIALAIEELLMPCYRCIGCRQARTNSWAIRMVKHAEMFDPINYPDKRGNCFITLTFNEEHLRSDRSLRLRDFQLFIKRVRKHFGAGISYYHCGEYGSKWGRPHYHACMFNLDFPDKVLHCVRRGINLYTSELLSSFWTDPKTGKSFGFCSVGDLNVKTAAYVARYTMKKIYGASMYLEGVDQSTNEVVALLPEYATMSNGIAKDWLRMFVLDVYPDDFIIHNTIKYKPPRYFDNFLEFTSPEVFNAVKVKRSEFAAKRALVTSPQTRSAAEKNKLAAMKRLVRSID